MPSWDYVNIGTSAKKENMNYVKQLFDCFNIDYENIDELSINDYGKRTPFYEDFKPDLIGNANNATIGRKDLYFLLNNLFGSTYVFWEHEEGSTITDYSSESEEIYNPVNNKIYSATRPDDEGNFDTYKKAIKELLPYSKFVELFKIDINEYTKEEFDDFIETMMFYGDFPYIDYDSFMDFMEGYSNIEEESFYYITNELSESGVVCYESFDVGDCETTWASDEFNIEMQEVNPEIIEMLIESATSKGYTELVALINEKIK